ncbi:MAG: putative lipid II flippase FtsW [bacterium]
MTHATRSLGDAMTVQLRQRLDLGLLVAVLALLGLGIVMVTSASIDVAAKEYGNPYHFFVRQLLYAVVGGLGAYVAYQTPLRQWERLGVSLLLAAIALLIVVLIPGVGRQVNGAVRWINLGPVAVQVSEFAKLLIFLYLAGYLVRHAEEVRTSFKGFLKPVVAISIAIALLLKEPDFGAAVVVFSVMLGMLFIGGARMSQFIMLVAVGAASFAILALTSPYRMKRLASFMNPWDEPFSSGFQLTQSLMAIGSGSWGGVGLGASIQKQFYLPEAHNDFLFAILGEELGLIGVFAVIVLYVYVLWRAFAIGATAERAGHMFGGYLAFGIGLWIGFQAFVNMGVNMGVLPTKGLTLPLMSAGGSSMLATCFAVGLLLRVHREVHDLSLSGVPVKPAEVVR